MLDCFKTFNVRLHSCSFWKPLKLSGVILQAQTLFGLGRLPVM